MNLSRFSVLAVFFMMVMSAFVAVPMYNVGADEHEGGPYLNAFPTGGGGDPSDYEMSVDTSEGGANITVEATELIDGTSYKLEWEIFDIVDDMIGADGYWDFSGGSSSESVQYFIGQEVFDGLGTGCYMFTGWLIDLDAGVEIENESWPFTLDLPFSACDDDPDEGDCPFDDREGSPCEDVATNPCREDHESEECRDYVVSYCEANEDPGCYTLLPPEHHNFVCGDWVEIPFGWVNDGYEDCSDGSDEQQYDEEGVPINWFDCHDGSMILLSKVNNGIEDCYDGEDEDYGGDDYDDDGPRPESFDATLTMDSLEDWSVDYTAEMSAADSDDMRREIAWMCADMMGTEDNEITNNCFDQWIEMINSDDGGDDGDGMGCPPGLTELQCENFMSCMDENGDIICSMLEFQRNLYNICNDDDSHEFCYYSDEEGRDMFNAAFAYEDGDLSAEDFMELIVDSMFGDDTGMGMKEMYVIYDGVEITIGAEDAGEYVIDIDSNCYQIEEDEWECFYPHYVMLMDGDDIVAIKEDYCEWDSEDITNVECNSEIRMNLSEGTYNLVTATGCYNEWDEATEEYGDLICDQTGEYNYTMYWAENMTENRNILGSVDDDSPVMEFDYMDYMELQGNYGFAPVYETYEFNVGPDGFEGEIFSYQYRWENNCEDDCESDANMILWVYEYSFNPDNTVDNLMATSSYMDSSSFDDEEYSCCYSMLDLELTEGTYVFVMSGDYTQMISDDWATLYHETIISEHDDEGGANDLEWYGTLDSNDSRAYFPSNYYDYEDHGDDNGDGDEMWLFMAMIENVTAYQDEDITAEEAANNFIDLMYTADAMGLYDDNDGDGDGMMDWESWNYCEWEGDDWDGDTMWYCTDNANGNDGFDDWWYYCEMHDDGVGGSIYYCTDDFGQSLDYEFSASNDHYVTGGRPEHSDGGGDDGDCPFDSMDFCYEIGPYCDPESGDYDPAYCGAESAHYCLEDGANDEGCAEIDDLEAACAAGEVPQVICDAFLNFDHDAYHDGDDEDDHARLDGIIGAEDPPNADPVISPTNIVGALSDNEGLPMMYTGSFKLKFEGVDASLETHEVYIPVGDDGGVWHIGINLLDGYEVLSCEGCGDTLEIQGSNAKFSTMEPATITFGKVVEVDTNECDQIVTIGADGYSFEPADITIAAGDTVCWMWKDTTDAHNVAEIATKFDADMNLEDAKIGFYSGKIANSVDFRHTFDENDKTHYYICEPHATMGMAGTVTVGNGTAEDSIQTIAEESGLPSIGFVVGALALVGAAGLRRRIH